MADTAEVIALGALEDQCAVVQDKVYDRFEQMVEGTVAVVATGPDLHQMPASDLGNTRSAHPWNLTCSLRMSGRILSVLVVEAAVASVDSHHFGNSLFVFDLEASPELGIHLHPVKTSSVSSPEVELAQMG